MIQTITILSERKEPMQTKSDILFNNSGDISLQIRKMRDSLRKCSVNGIKELLSELKCRVFDFSKNGIVVHYYNCVTIESVWVENGYLMFKLSDNEGIVSENLIDAETLYDIQCRIYVSAKLKF